LDNKEFRNGNEDAGITDDERGAINKKEITPLEEQELRLFVEKYKNEKDHSQYFECFKK